MPGQRILIVQENLRERIKTTEILQNLGFRVDAAQDGNAAEEMSASHDFLMVVADVDTPGFSGTQFLKKIRGKSAGTQVLFISEEPLVEEAVDLMKEGAFDFLVKPVGKEQLELCARSVSALDRHDRPDRIDRLPDRPESPLPEHPATSKKGVVIITRDSEMERILKLAAKVADSSASVLIQGESGTGKELFAKHLHELSSRRDMPFVAINCAALPESLLESELFGHEKGAFTGAISRKIGKFELAHGGTLFLDEITEMQYHLQAKLLRVLQEKQIDRVGGCNPVDVDVRIIATTNRDVTESIQNNEFREDLYYRLSTIPLVIPPLRSRRCDIELLARFFVEKYSRIDGRPVNGLTPQTMEILNALPFTGNVRELENIIHRAVLLAEHSLIHPDDLMVDLSGRPAPPPESAQDFPCPLVPSPLKEMEEKMIFHTLDRTEGNRTHAAKLLGISVRTLRNKLNEYKSEANSGNKA
ncbi:MAG: sigma-54 dependent transcriptional regulator [Pseudomonadota bacterium]